MRRNFHFFLRLRSRLLWPLLMLQTITPHALSSPTMPLVSEPGRRPKPQYISAMEHLFPFRGGAGPRHAPTFFCAATLHDSLFWEAQVGTWDTKLTKHLVSLQWGQLVPWQCRWPCSATRWTTRSCISWQSRKRGISCLHNFRPRRGGEATRNLRIRAEGSHLRLQERASNLSRCDGPLSSLGCFPGSHPMHAGKRSRICSSQNRNKWVRQYLGEWKIRRIVKVDSRIVLT